VWITSITVFETRLGLAVLPESRRRRALEAAFARRLEDDLENRVLDFDAAAATSAAVLAADRQKAGRPADLRDMQIAGIALARHAMPATRNMRHFADLKVPVVELVSWDFKHIVRLETIRLFHDVNGQLGYKALSILSPREVTTV